MANNCNGGEQYMMKKILVIIGVVLGSILGAEFSKSMTFGLNANYPSYSFLTQSNTYYMSIAIGAFSGWLIMSIFSKSIVQIIQLGVQRAEQLPLRQLLSGVGGLCAGLLIAALIYPAIAMLGGLSKLIPLLLAVCCGYIGMQIGVKKQDDLVDAAKKMFERKGSAHAGEVKGFEEHKILDTSVIIDGRIADICKTGFIEGTLVIPEFVLEELQHIADSSDLLKRNRGRRGLDILNKIQKELDVHVLVYEGDFEEITEVDSKLVKLAKVLSGKVVTNDFNLNKVCELQGVSVLNINDLANAVKPVVLPGEEIVVQLIKDGKENGQGVAYLDDGTMIVVEGGRDFIGHTMEVLVTSVLQTSAGRMIFAKPKLLEKAL